MGDRIVIGITDGNGEYSPDFYGHWCGLRGLKVMNDCIRLRQYNSIHNLMCNFIVEVMDRMPQRYSFYVYNHNEAYGAAEWDNYDWEYNLKTEKWTTTHPDFKGRELSIEEVDDYIKSNRPCLYRICSMDCEDYGKDDCVIAMLKDKE